MTEQSSAFAQRAGFMAHSAGIIASSMLSFHCSVTNRRGLPTAVVAAPLRVACRQIRPAWLIILNTVP